MLLSAICLISGGPSDGGRVGGCRGGVGAGVSRSASVAAVAAAREAGFEPEDGELFCHARCRLPDAPASCCRAGSVPRSVLDSVASELVTIHGQADQLRIASPARQREFRTVTPVTTRRWPPMAGRGGLRAMDERLERLSSQESSTRQQADYS